MNKLKILIEVRLKELFALLDNATQEQCVEIFHRRAELLDVLEWLIPQCEEKNDDSDR